MKIAIIAIEALVEGTNEEQAVSCISQLNDLSSISYPAPLSIIAINFFVSADNNDAYLRNVQLIKSCLPDHYKKNVPIAFLAQAPANGSFVSSEVHYISDSAINIEAKQESGNIYLLVTKDPDEKLVIANGIEAGRQNHEIPEDSERVFGIMERILLSEGMNFSNIFRQWNYIEDITHVEKESEITSQHYQVFNNIRSKYYAKADFHQGYPSATGIGTRAGGVLVSFYALKQNGYQFFSLENPLQKAAFEYTDEVLIGDSDYEGYSKCTPKFARAKLVSNSETEQVFISGTASIREEQTVGINDVGRQTEITIENILQLISRETLSPISNKVTELPKIEFIRVYIKDQADFKVVKDTCNQMLPGIPGVYVVSDVCREDLLVEIEALASVAY